MDKDLITLLIEGVFSGEISLFKLPELLYFWTFEKLDNSFKKGFGEVLGTDKFLNQKAFNYRTNISRFSGAKTFQNIKELSDNVFLPNGIKRPFADFKKTALKINEKYNIEWLKAENDLAIKQAQNARKWIKYESEKDIFPILEYVSVGDQRVRPSHKKLDGLKKPVDDPIWNTIFPANGWRCRCIVIRHRKANTTTENETKDKTKEIEKEFKKNPEFAFNVGKKEYLFKESGKGKNNYFKVPREFSNELKNNFGFPKISK